MFSREERLIKKDDFNAVYRFGRFFSFGSVSLKIKANNLAKTRVGFSVGLKFSKRAVDRNRVKRRLRAIIGKKLAGLKKGFDVVIMVKGSPRDLDSQKLEKDLEMIFRKSNLIN